MSVGNTSKYLQVQRTVVVKATTPCIPKSLKQSSNAKDYRFYSFPGQRNNACPLDRNFLLMEVVYFVQV